MAAEVAISGILRIDYEFLLKDHGISAQCRSLFPKHIQNVDVLANGQEVAIFPRGMKYLDVPYQSQLFVGLLRGVSEYAHMFCRRGRMLLLGAHRLCRASAQADECDSHN